ncbi:MAG: hypothetical protein FJ278_01140, partial [Planctomycetes bacterium]|nr:hypothetical protein [Planctomycetota bacterium]
MLPFIPISRGLPAPRAWMVVEPRGFAQHLGEALSIHVYPQSVFCDRRVFYFIARRGIEKLLGLACQPGEHRGVMRDFRGQTHLIDVFEVKIGPADHANARALRKHLPFTRPALVGIETSIGCGDRLGLATPGHIRAVRGTGVKPYFAQQSIREMTRTQRTADEVMDAATYGVLQEGWREGFGSDADHLKTAEDVDVTVAAGFTMFTIDPGAHVDNAADSDSSGALAQKFESLPWVDLEDTAADCRGRYLGKRFHMADGLALELSDERLQRAAAKYGRAVAHTARLYRHLATRMGRK